MKTYLLTLLAVLFISCNNDDDSPANPVDELPPATQTGENTFGCLINGRPFTPRGVPFGPPSKGATYQYVYNPQNESGHYSFQVFGDNYETDERVSINLGLSNYDDFIINNYAINTMTWDGIGCIGIYLYGSNGYDTTIENNGNLIINYLDHENRIVSGTFEFDVDVDGETYYITDGRFDFNF